MLRRPVATCEMKLGQTVADILKALQDTQQRMVQLQEDNQRKNEEGFKKAVEIANAGQRKK